MNAPHLLTSPRFLPWGTQLFLAYEWIHAGWEKLVGGTFTGTLRSTLERFSANTPHRWYAESVLRAAKASSSWFAATVTWGELLVGIGLIASLLLTIYNPSPRNKRLACMVAIGALAGGAFMNLNFYLAAGWTSPSTNGLNIFMGGIQMLLALYWVGTWKTLTR